MTDKEKREVLELVNQAKAGNQLAYSKLYNKYVRLIRYVVYDILRNKDATDDVVSETFTKAFMKLDTFVENISFETWLKTIAINRSIDHIRRTHEDNRNIFVDDDDCYLQLNSSESSPEEVLIQKESVNRINDAYDTLRPLYRTLLDMKINKGLDNAQIGKEMGLTEIQVRDLVHRARNRLKKFINN